MIVDRLEVSYCEGWDSLNCAAVGPLSLELATERHLGGEQYAVLLSAAGRPLVLIEVALRELHCGLRFLDEQLRRVLEINCRLLADNRLFIIEQRQDPFNDPELSRRHDREWARVITPSPDGLVLDSQIQPGGSVQQRWGSAETERYWVDAPAFGDWGQFIRAFPEALDVAGLEIPEAVILDDVSVPQGTGLPAAERPWQPPRPLTPDPIHLARLFTPGTRLTYDNTEDRLVRDTGGPTKKVITEVMDAGMLRMPSGRLVAKDPGWIDDKDQPFSVTVPPGEYPVRLSVVRFADNAEHKRVAAAKLVIRDEPAQFWEMALLPGQDPRTLADMAFYGFAADGGMACFYDASATAAFAGLDHWDVLGGAITSTMNDPGSGTNLIAFESGWGDGAYPTWIGRASDGDVVCFVADMLLLPGDTAADTN
ncbi:MAG: DUF4241 domain-containing protein [Nocardiopsaceae bacterium]|jgi:hypothetical protein|nr:DUF4241 domain-containing protein [Nocardiopsaceae bacterium]